MISDAKEDKGYGDSGSVMISSVSSVAVEAAAKYRTVIVACDVM